MCLHITLCLYNVNVELHSWCFVMLVDYLHGGRSKRRSLSMATKALKQCVSVQKRCNMCRTHTHTYANSVLPKRLLRAFLRCCCYSSCYVSVLIECLGLFHSYDSICVCVCVLASMYVLLSAEIGFASNFMSFAVAALGTLCLTVPMIQPLL